MIILAYIDAGTGSLLIQMLAGGIAGLAVFVRFRWGTVKGWFKQGEDPEQESGVEGPEANVVSRPE
jgi:hypothetical protein